MAENSVRQSETSSDSEARYGAPNAGDRVPPPATSAIGIMHINTQHCISYISPTAAQILELEASLLASWLGYPITQLELAQDPQAQPILAKILSGKALTGEQVRWKHPLGHTMYLEVHSAPLLAASGAWEGAVIIFQNVTTRELALRAQRQMVAALERRTAQLETAAQIAQAASSILNVDQLINESVHLLRDRFGLYYVGLFEVDPTGKWAVLRAGTGEAGQHLLAEGYRLPIDASSMTGWCITHRRARLAPDVSQDAVYHLNPLLPETRAELALPLTSRGEVIGALSIQSAQEGALNEADMMVFQLLADQLATAIANARLYEQAREDALTKSMLLEEINHRVKNNLAAIMGILTLEMKRAFEGPQDYYATLQDIYNRIQSITTVHNLLAETQWMPLPLVRLVEEIIHVVLGASPLRQQVKVQVRSEATPPDVETLFISPQQATGLAIIINELTTNSIKHAFAAQEEGRITVHIRSKKQNGSRQVHLEYRDTGPGWPADVLNGTRSSIGLRLIRMTVISPLRGQVELYNDSGAAAAITFELLPAAEKATLSR